MLANLLLEIRLVHIERLTLIKWELTRVHLIEEMSVNTENTRTMLLSILKLHVWYPAGKYYHIEKMRANKFFVASLHLSPNKDSTRFRCFVIAFRVSHPKVRFLVMYWFVQWKKCWWLFKIRFSTLSSMSITFTSRDSLFPVNMKKYLCSSTYLTCFTWCDSMFELRRWRVKSLVRRKYTPTMNTMWRTRLGLLHDKLYDSLRHCKIVLPFFFND
jgi:hypothetical protein